MKTGVKLMISAKGFLCQHFHGVWESFQPAVRHQLPQRTVVACVNTQGRHHVAPGFPNLGERPTCFN